MYSAFVVLWTGVQRTSMTERFDTYTQATRWLHAQRVRYGSAFVQGFVL